jgi:hypothetical protein
MWFGAATLRGDIVHRPSGSIVYGVKAVLEKLLEDSLFRFYSFHSRNSTEGYFKDCVFLIWTQFDSDLKRPSTENVRQNLVHHLLWWHRPRPPKWWHAPRYGRRLWSPFPRRLHQAMDRRVSLFWIIGHHFWYGFYEWEWSGFAFLEES